MDAPKKAATPVATSSNEHICANCGKHGTGFAHCGRCKLVHYCERNCQRKHWRHLHRHTCRIPGEGDGARGSINDKTCEICLTDFVEGDRILPLACLHRFHTDCINELQRKGAKTNCIWHMCPVCRKNLPISVDTLLADAWMLSTRADKDRLTAAEQRALKDESEAKLREAIGRDPNNATLINDLALSMLDRGRYADATTMLRRALELRENDPKFGPKHEATLLVVKNLTHLLCEQGQLDAALNLALRAVEGSKETHGATHEKTFHAIAHLAKVYIDLGDLDKATQCYNEILAHEATLGEDHELTNLAVGDKAHILRRQGKLAEALPLLRRVLDENKRLKGDEHPKTLSNRGNLAAALMELKQFDEAVPMMRQVLAAKEVRYGPNHPHTIHSVWNFACALAWLGFECPEKRDIVEQGGMLHRVIFGCVSNPDDAILRSILGQAEEPMSGFTIATMMKEDRNALLQ